MKISKAVSIIRAAISQGDCYRRFSVSQEMVKRKEALLVFSRRNGQPPSDLLILCQALETILSRRKWLQVSPRLGFTIDGMPKNRFIRKFIQSDAYLWKWYVERKTQRIYLCPRENTVFDRLHLIRAPWRVFGNSIRVSLYVSLNLVDRDNWIKHCGSLPPWEVEPPVVRKRDRSHIQPKPDKFAPRVRDRSLINK